MVDAERFCSLIKNIYNKLSNFICCEYECTCFLYINHWPVYIRCQTSGKGKIRTFNPIKLVNPALWLMNLPGAFSCFNWLIIIPAGLFSEHCRFITRCKYYWHWPIPTICHTRWLLWQIHRLLYVEFMLVYCEFVWFLVGNYCICDKCFIYGHNFLRPEKSAV